MSYWTGTEQLQFSWSQIVTGFWQRYPNPYSNHVLTEDVLDRRCSDGKLVTRRLISKKGKVPSFAERLCYGVKNAYFIEESVLDLTSQTLTTYTRNINMLHVMDMHEKCEYAASEEDNNNCVTMVTRQAWATSPVSGLGGILSMYSVNQYRRNVEKTSRGFVYVLNSLYNPELLQVSKNTTDSVKQVGYLLRMLQRLHRTLRVIIGQLFHARKTQQILP